MHPLPIIWMMGHRAGVSDPFHVMFRLPLLSGGGSGRGHVKADCPINHQDFGQFRNFDLYHE